MFRLNFIKLKGFKDPDREVTVEFSKEPITVIYGENGCGKTTLLKVLYAIFKNDLVYLDNEHISKVILGYSLENKEEKEISIILEKDRDGFGSSILGDIGDLDNLTSILFGVNRGLVSTDISINENLLKSNFPSESSKLIKYFFSHRDEMIAQKEKLEINTDFSGENHILVDNIGIDRIESIIIKEYRAAQRDISEKVKNAFLNTISNAVDIELNTKEYPLPDEFENRLEKIRPTLISLVEKLDKSTVQTQLLDYLHHGTKKAISESKIFRALLVNILEKVEEVNPQLKSIDKLISIFNSHLYKNKKLVVTDEEIYIDCANLESKQSKDVHDKNKKVHDLNKLSSGERHLLVFLTLFLVIGRGRNFFIIDEPEISLNMKWQRELLPLLSELSPNSQIIVATHSPSIASNNSNYLVEML